MASAGFRTATYYLTISFGPGMLDELETEVHYYWTPATEDDPADVELHKVMLGHTDLRSELPEGLQRKIEADILTNELTGVFA
jgi:hypothetical protein